MEAELILDICPSDIYEMKEVDRKLSRFVVSPSSIICDVGGFKGVDALPLARRGAFCVCLEIDKAAVISGKKLSKKIGLNPKIEFVVASATNMPFKDSSIDLVTCFSVLDHLPNKNCVRLAVCEFSRVIRNQSYVAITFPNALFIIGTISMRLKQTIDSDTFFEQRFTPKEMREILIFSGLTPVTFESKYPTKVGHAILSNNFPKSMRKIPQKFIWPTFSVAEKVFRILEKKPWLRLFGARCGYLSQKRINH